MNNAEIAKQLRDLREANTRMLVITGFLFLSSLGQRAMLSDLTDEIVKEVAKPQPGPDVIEGTAEEIT